MANLSYCRFQNTLSALRDCADNLFEAGMSEDEKHARKMLISTCRRIIEGIETYGEDFVQEETEDEFDDDFFRERVMVDDTGIYKVGAPYSDTAGWRGIVIEIVDAHAMWVEVTG